MPIKTEAREELKGIVKELQQELPNEKLTALEQKWAEKEEQDAKFMEEHKELKDKYDALQDKLVTMKQKTGENTYRFKGFDPNMAKNFKSTISESDAELVAKAHIDMIKANASGDVLAYAGEKVFDGAYAVPVQYGNALLGLAELQSVAMTYANVIVADAPTIKLPVKGTRDAVDAQSPGTANTAASSTLGQITWTIDKRVGNYVEIYNTQLEDANFDIVNQFIIPLQAEAIGQDADDEMFNGTEFTTSVSDASASVTASGVSATASAITLANLTTMYNSLSWDRGIQNPMWFGSQQAYAAIMALAGSTNDHPLFLPVPITQAPSKSLMGCPYVVTSVIANAPDDGAIRLAFGDPRHYTIFIRGNRFTSLVNPYIKMKEDVTQFICKARMDGNIDDHATASSSGAWTTLKRVDS